MSKNSGIIYQLSENRWGVAINKEQLPEFANFNRVYLHIYTDRICTTPELDPVTKKKVVTLKHISKVKQVGFID